ncbi:hypothetical protein QYF61_006728, partial [Mycteria americana]
MHLAPVMLTVQTPADAFGVSTCHDEDNTQRVRYASIVRHTNKWQNLARTQLCFSDLVQEWQSPPKAAWRRVSQGTSTKSLLMEPCAIAHQIFSVRHTPRKEHYGTLLRTSTPSIPVTCSFNNTKASGFRTLKGITESQNHIGWKRPLRSSSPTINLTLPKPPLHHVSKHLIQTSFKYLQGWRLNHFPGQPVPMLDNPLGEEKFPNIQSKPPLAQLEAISSCPITCYLGEETNPHLSTTSFQVVVESDKVSPQPPFLQAKQSQLPQPLLIRLLLQTLHQLGCPSLHTLQHLNIPLVARGPKLNTVFEGHNHFPSPAGHAIFDTSQDAIGFLGHLGTLLARMQAAVNKHPQVLLCQAAFQPLFPKPVALHGVAVAQPLPMLDNPFSEEIFSNIQSKPPLAQLEAIPSRPIACYLAEETNAHLSTASFQVVVESDKVSPQPPFLQAKQPQFPQPLLSEDFCSRPFASFLALLWTRSSTSMPF